MKLEVQTIVLVFLLVVAGLWVDKTRKHPSMRKVDKAIFDGV